MNTRQNIDIYYSRYDIDNENSAINSNVLENTNETFSINYIRKINPVLYQKSLHNMNNKYNYLFEKNINDKLYLYLLMGWFRKDNKLLDKMNKYKNNGTCYSCFKKCCYNEIFVVKTLSYKNVCRKIEKLNNYFLNDYLKNPLTTVNIKDIYGDQKISNIFCICIDCSNKINLNFIPYAPKNINNVINKFDLNYANNKNIYNLLEKNYSKLNKEIRKLNNETVKLLKIKNNLTYNNELMQKFTALEKQKYIELKKNYSENLKLLESYKNNISEKMNEINQCFINKIEDTYNTVISFNENKTNDESELQCRICSNNKINIVLNHCGHTLCSDCMNVMSGNYQQSLLKYTNYINGHYVNPTDMQDYSYKPEFNCPHCRTKIKKWTLIYF
jgi:hypothetical protein